MPKYADVTNVLKLMHERYDELEKKYTHYDAYTSGYDECMELLEEQEFVDCAPVVHSKWILTPHASYRDTMSEARELAASVSASCGECGEKHPNHFVVYSRTLYPPEEEDEYEYEWNLEEEKEKALRDFMEHYAEKYPFANYCPHCGAKTDGIKEYING